MAGVTVKAKDKIRKSRQMISRNPQTVQLIEVVVTVTLVIKTFAFLFLSFKLCIFLYIRCLTPTSLHEGLPTALYLTE